MSSPQVTIVSLDEKTVELIQQAVETELAKRNAKLREAVLRLKEFVPEVGIPLGLRRSEWGYTSKDNEAPLFSEAWLYLVLGKEDARTVLALMRPVWEAAGINRWEQP